MSHHRQPIEVLKVSKRKGKKWKFYSKKLRQEVYENCCEPKNLTKFRKGNWKNNQK